MSDDFTCAECHGTFTKAWTDQEAWAKARAEWGDDLDDPRIVCDDCYEKMMRTLPIPQYRKGLRYEIAQRLTDDEDGDWWQLNFDETRDPSDDE